jgi:rSAM/selenodomain-associated transferase 1
VKSRLAATIGAERALRIYRFLGERTMRVARSVGDAQLAVRITPDEGVETARAWLGNAIYLGQGAGDLGERMSRAIEEALGDGADRVVIVGTDCPTLDEPLIERAFAALEHADVVLGPASDGGYYLVAVRRLEPAIFTGIPWSTPEVLEKTCAAAAGAGLTLTLVDERRDVDTIDDWRRWAQGAPGEVPDDFAPDAAQATAPPHELPAPAVQP